ncbi:hypothetical protein [Salinisphaera sp. Q1T1-3]|uniref:hypothetical protein n=1 Tax=Salinisphaera sp. Q1T1-3 TaxID=2321229 RepID=UPI000E7340A1|nr:hypothetical protein [Salinisphaera sp. Q1T1-3]RJS94860.1 hypothetical protein D3260_03615 [Salinisphaera sp. Q1T1-3]
MDIDKRRIAVTAIIGCLLSLSGCVPMVSGDLEDIAHARYQPCVRAATPYRIDVESNAEDAYASGPVSWLTDLSLGLIPTFQSEVIDSRARLYRDGVLQHTYRFKSRVTVYYGWVWLLFLDTDSVNALPVDEGAGVRARTGIRDRTIAKALSESDLDIAPNALCYSDD